MKLPAAKFKNLSTEWKSVVDQAFQRWGELNYSPVTVSQYRKWAIRFCYWLQEIGITQASSIPSDASERFLQIYALHKQATRQTLAVAINAFIKQQVIENVLQKDFTLVQMPMTKERRIPPIVPLQTVQQLIEAAKKLSDEGAVGLAIFTAIMILVYAGLRLSEVARLQVENLVRGADGSIKSFQIIRKNNCISTVQIHPTLALALEKWIENRPRRGDQRFMFPGKSNGPTTPNTIYRYVRETAMQAQVAFTPRLFRAFLANALAETATQVHDLQQIMGHSSPASLVSYCNSGPESQRNRLDEVLKPLCCKS